MELQDVIAVMIYWVQLVTFPYCNLTYAFNHYYKTQGIFLCITHYQNEEVI